MPSPSRGLVLQPDARQLSHRVSQSRLPQRLCQQLRYLDPVQRASGSRCSVAAYGLSQQPAELRRSKEKFILSLRIAPALLFVIPLYYLATRIGAMNQHWLLIAAYAFVNVPFAISLLITFFDDIPKELRDAARVDGAREFSVFWHVYLPAARGGMVATLILCVLFTWNEFFVALVLTGRDTQTLPVSITSFLTFQGIQWGALTAAATLIMLPMIVLGVLVQGQIVRGMTLGSVKG